MIAQIFALTLLVISIPISVFLTQSKQEVRKDASYPIESTSGITPQIKTMVIQYIPPGGVTTLYPSTPIPDPTSFMKNTMIPTMNRATQFHGYSDSSAPNAINFTLADEDIFTINSPPPTRSDNPLGAPPKADNQPGYLDMAAIFRNQNICSFAKQKDIRVILLVMADYGPYAPKGFESYITGNKGIPTNGPILRGSDYCDDKTIYIVAPVYTRGLAEALESYGHHLEGVFRHFKPQEYTSWSDEQAFGYYPPQRGDSCGTDHNPPNARHEYDRSNTLDFQSDCRDWRIDGTGVKETLNCNAWDCSGAGWIAWWMQNMPTDWWRYFANPDGTPQRAGDIDQDGDVDIFDYNILVSNFGKNSPDNLNGADLDNDGDVDIFDYNILVGNFGR